MLTQPYLTFEGRAEEAIDFYVKALGAKVTMMFRFSESPPPPEGSPYEGMPTPPGDKIMHASLTIGDNVVMMSDGMCMGPNKAEFKGFALSLNVKDKAEAERIYAALTANGGTAQMPLEETFFSPAFGVLADKFGVPWMVVVEQAA
ncbi:VOC family protein [Aquabacter sp. CN5-332]|uniref:VOC family protein n=1 Tax=Aquabacter sp. CN5-332 TaxID=3156608 RepID=UPI0032B48059